MCESVCESVYVRNKKKRERKRERENCDTPRVILQMSNLPCMTNCTMPRVKPKYNARLPYTRVFALAPFLLQCFKHMAQDTSCCCACAATTRVFALAPLLLQCNKHMAQDTCCCACADTTHLQHLCCNAKYQHGI